MIYSRDTACRAPTTLGLATPKDVCHIKVVDVPVIDISVAVQWVPYSLTFPVNVNQDGSPNTQYLIPDIQYLSFILDIITP